VAPAKELQDTDCLVHIERCSGRLGLTAGRDSGLSEAAKPQFLLHVCMVPAEVRRGEMGAMPHCHCASRSAVTRLSPVATWTGNPQPLPYAAN
jgi:hypothetical protein